jgi:peptidyl-prolyl cis-trans isomerase C
MITGTDISNGCGSGRCGCAEAAQVAALAVEAVAVAKVNGVALHALGEVLPSDELRERAYSELLRQEAVRQGRLSAVAGNQAPELTAETQQVIEAMLDELIETPTPTLEACERYYAAHKVKYMVGLAMHVRHILFAVTPGVDVHVLAQRAELALLELSRKEVPPHRFEALARELSNCPTGANGGDLGWIGPDDCAPELANELFYQSNRLGGQGVHPLLVHTRFGFHIIEVLGRRHGRQQPFEEVRERIERQLAMQSRATALRQYMLLLVGQADLEHLSLEGADSPLVQ